MTLESAEVAIVKALAWLSGRAGLRREGLRVFVHPTTGIGRDQRASPRYPSSLSLRFAFSCREDDPVQTGRLVNISRSGALAMLADRPSVGERLVVSLESDRRAAQVEAIVWSVEPGDECFRVRLAFRRMCPKALFDAAISAASPGDPAC